MRKLLTLSVALVLIVSPLAGIPSAHAAISEWQKGASVIPTSSSDYASANFQQSMRNFKAAGGNSVNLIIPLYQSNSGSTDIQNGWNTPTDASLVSGIQYAHSLGLRVEISIYLETWSGEWRALINPGDRNTWYQKYGDALVHYGQIASAQGVEQFCLGAELIKMAAASMNGDNTERWVAMIARVRAAYGGALIYSANRGGSDWTSELPNIQFWDKLDYIGVSAYYELYGDGSVASLKADWQNDNNYDISPATTRWGKPVIITEVGYKSVGGAHNQPWNPWYGGGYDPQEQVNDYTALFDYWNGQSFMKGVYLWNWNTDPNSGGSGNTDYTPQNKPAQQTMREWWGASTPPSGGGCTTNCGTPPPTPPSNVTASGSATPTNPGVNSAVNLSATVNIGSGTLSSGVVDLEVYDQANTKVFQKFFENETFSGSKQYSAQWNPTTAGPYRLTVGVFSNGWAQAYAWNNDAADVNAGGSTPPNNPPPSSGVTDVWWPTDGSHVSGVQPFKAMVEGMDISQYTMYWQVGDGALVLMNDTPEGYPHKEALVDLSGWNWESSGSYPINFVSKNSSGATISQKLIHIFVP